MPVRDNKITHRSLYTCEGCCANYRVGVGHLGTNTIQLLYLNMPISGLYCMNYRVAVSHLGTNTILQLYLNTPISGPYCFNYRVAVGLLEGQGWERKRPTLSKWCIKPRKAVGLGPFLLVSLHGNAGYISCLYSSFIHVIISPLHAFTFASLPYLQPNRYAVVNEIAISLPAKYCSRHTAYYLQTHESFSS